LTNANEFSDEGLTMRHTAVTHFFGVLLIFSIGNPAAYPADTGESLYQARCAECHGKSGQGKRRMKAPSLVSAEMTKMSDDQLKAVIQQRANGEMERKSTHTELKKRLTAEQVSDLIAYMRKMQGR
jgi:mono/diheme cytochrome c family protein